MRACPNINRRERISTFSAISVCLLTEECHCSGVSLPSLIAFVSYVMEKKEKLSDAEVILTLTFNHIAPFSEGNFLCFR